MESINATKKWLRKVSITGIYRIKSPTGRIYIGQSWDIKNRWRLHRSGAKSKNGCPILEASFKKYGHESHLFEIIHLLPCDVSQDTLNEYEQFYIKQYFECGCNMMNISLGGGNGRTSEETKEKLRKAMMGNSWGFKKGELPWNAGTKGVVVSWNKGLKGYRVTSEEVKEKLRKFHTGKQWSLGRKLSPEHAEKLRQSNVGRKMSDELKKKLIESRTGENIHKMAGVNKGKVRTPENREKIRQTLLNMDSNKGELHPTSKMTNKEVLEIRAKYIPFIYTTTMLAKEYNVSKTNIKDIIKRKIWRHI